MKIKVKDEIKQTKTEDMKKNEVSIPEFDLTDLLQKQAQEIQDAVDGRVEWQAKQNKFFRQRYGLRQKAVFPWYNASSQHLPMQDGTIRSFKPEYVAVGYNVSPMCELTAVGDENIQVSEEASWRFDWLLRTKMDVFEPMVLMVDKMLGKGFCLVKTIYSCEYESKLITIDREELEAKLIKKLLNKADVDIISNPEKINVLSQLIARAYGFDLENASDYNKVMSICMELYKGTKTIDFTVEEERYNAPKWVVLDPEDVVVPPETDSVFDLERARWICHKYSVTPQEMLRNSLIGKWDKEEVERQLENSGVYDENIAKAKYQEKGANQKDTTAKMQQRTRDGISIGENNINLDINEVCLWYDSDNDGLEERFIMDYVEGSDVPLRFIRYPYEMLMWPYVKIIFELAETRHYSNRGTVEIEEPLAVALNVQHNMKINRQTIASTPTLLYAANKVNPYNMQYIPGQATPVEPPIQENIQWFMPTNTDQTFMQEEATLKNWDMDYMARNDFGNDDETATKTKYNASSRVGVRTLDIQIFQRSLKELFKRTWALDLQYNEEEQFTFVDGDGETKVIDKAALFRDYQFQPMGSFGSSNPTLSAQIAARQFEEFKGDPLIRQRELYREHITKQSDPRVCKRILKSDKEMKEEQKLQAKAMEAERTRQLQEQIMLSQVGAKGGISTQPGVVRPTRKGNQVIGKPSNQNQ